MMLLSKVFLTEEPVKDGIQQRKHDSIQYNQLDLCLWQRNQAIHTYKTVNMGKKRHYLLINDWRDYNLHALVLRAPSNGSLPLTHLASNSSRNILTDFGCSTQFFILLPMGYRPVFKGMEGYLWLRISWVRWI